MANKIEYIFSLRDQIGENEVGPFRRTGKS